MNHNLLKNLFTALALMAAANLTAADWVRKKVWGIERSGFFNGREKWAKGFENQRV